MIKKKIVLWIMAISLMTGIFYMSSQPGNKTNTSSYKVIDTIEFIVNPEYRGMTQAEKRVIQEKYNYVTRKITHATIYFLLCMILLFALRNKMMIAITLTLIYAVSDELHQRFVSGRSPHLTDVLIDMSGAILAVSLFYLFSRRKRVKGESTN